MLRLYTFTISHFSEKARWALDLNQLEYTEQALLPGPHMFTIRRRSKKSSVPLLEHDKKVVHGSSAILDYLEKELGAKRIAAPPAAADRALELEELVDRAFGLGTQRIFYASFLETPDAVIDMWTQGAPAWGRTFYKLGFGFVAQAVRRMYTIEPVAVEEAKDLFRRAFDTTDAALAKSPYLLGDAPTRADITVASLLAPLCRPPEHRLKWPTTMPGELAEFVREFEGRPTSEHVLRMYREHRSLS